MKIGYFGLGKMGQGQALLFQEKGIEVVAYNRSDEGKEEGRKEGLKVATTIEEMVASLPAPRIIWIMVSHQAMDQVLGELYPLLSKGDIIIDGGNSYFKDSIRRASEAEGKGFEFLDVGVSGGPYGARHGACMMIGGKKEMYDHCEDLFKKASAPEAYAYMGKSAAGHFVKMVHNGIEYGMMQSFGEGFEVLKKSDFNLDLLSVAKIYNNKSVIESRLSSWLVDAFEKFTTELNGISGEVSHSGEGEWTVTTAKELGVPVKVIEDSLEFRKQSTGNPSYTGKIVSALRNRFGGHSVSEK